MRTSWTLLGAALLAGCVAPPLVTVASFGIDRLSLATTGKSVTDHALSLVVQRDCSVWRVVAQRSVGALCRLDGVRAFAGGQRLVRPREDSDWVAAPVRALQPLGASPAPRLAARPGRDETRSLARIAPAAAAASEGPARFLVIGSYAEPANAEAQRRRVAGARIVEAATEAGLRYRVVVPAPPHEALAAARRRLGVADAWPLALCGADLSTPPCTGDGALRLTRLDQAF